MPPEEASSDGLGIENSEWQGSTISFGKVCLSLLKPSTQAPGLREVSCLPVTGWGGGGRLTGVSCDLLLFLLPPCTPVLLLPVPVVLLPFYTDRNQVPSEAL